MERNQRKPVSRCDYAKWVASLKRRYRATQIKAAVAVNSALIEFYWSLGKDISERYPGEVYGGKFFEKLSADLRRELPDVRGFSKVNLTYCLRFHEMYGAAEIVQQVVEQLVQVSWGHHVVILDKCKFICKEHNRVLAKFHLEKLGLPMGISDYEIKKVLPTQTQLAQCYRDAERQLAQKGSKREAR